MPSPRPFRFTLNAHDASSGRDWTEQVRKAEDLGYSGVFIPDHFGHQLAPVAALATAAALTSLRVGMLVAANDFRHPVVLAKELATLDLLTEGRVEWGIGAGWLAPEYKAAGISFDRPSVRVDRLVEAIAVMKALFADEPASFEGQHYTVRDLDGHPKPVQRPHPPLLVGGTRRRMMTLAGREADIVGISPTPFDKSGPPVTRSQVEGATEMQLEWVRDGAGERYDDLELHMVAFPIVFDKDRSARSEKLAARTNMTPDAVLSSPQLWVGSAGSLRDTLVERRERWGVASWSIPAQFMEKAGPIVAALAGT